MDTKQTFPVPSSVAAAAWVNAAQYEALYRNPSSLQKSFWAKQGQRLTWIAPYTRVKDVSWNPDDFRIRWYDDGTLNVCANCLDRHIATRGDKVALIWEGNDPTQGVARLHTGNFWNTSADWHQQWYLWVFKQGTASAFICP